MPLVHHAPQASAGLEPDLFPAHLPVWTGHYHKPHTVPGTSICYVGAPYQVSRAEAGQAKRLLVLGHDGDAQAAWRLVEEVPLDVGPRHFSVEAGQGIDALASSGLRAGDRVRWTLRDEARAEEAAPTLQALRDEGALLFRKQARVILSTRHRAQACLCSWSWSRHRRWPLGSTPPRH